MSETPLLRYRWRHTWPEKGEDYLGIDEDFTFGRFSRVFGGPLDGQWSYGLQNFRHSSATSGYILGDARDVAAMIERNYDETLPLVDGLMVKIRQEVALFQRKGLPLPRGTLWRKACFIDGMSAEEANRLYTMSGENMTPESDP